MPETDDSHAGPTEEDAIEQAHGDLADSLTPESESIDAFKSRVATLEAENSELLSRYAAQLQRENQRIRQAMESRPSPAGRTTPGAPIAVPGKAAAPVTPSRLGRDLAAVENHLADMERFAAVGKMEDAAQAKVAAAMRACNSLRNVCDDADFRQLLMVMPGNAHKLPRDQQSPLDTQLAFGSFRDVEIALLELIGLNHVLAEKHVIDAAAAFTANPQAAMTRIEDPAALLDDLRALRDATCQSADVLAMGVQREASRTRWRKILAYGLGGTVIIAVNGFATTLLGPVGVAVSQAIGCAAVGVAAPLAG